MLGGADITGNNTKDNNQVLLDGNVGIEVPYQPKLDDKG